MFAFNTAEDGRLRTVAGRREAHAVGYVCDGISVGVDLELIDRVRCERLLHGGSRRVDADGRMHVHDEDRLTLLFRAGESIKVCEVKAGVPVGEPEIGAGVVVRHTSSPLFLIDFWNSEPDKE